MRETYEPIPVWLPKTWLLRARWRRHGLIGVREVPGAEGRGARASARGLTRAREPVLVD